MQHFLYSIVTYFKKDDTFMYRGWLVSDKVYKRLTAFAGYVVCALIAIEIIRVLIVYTILYIRLRF